MLGELLQNTDCDDMLLHIKYKVMYVLTKCFYKID